MSWTVRESSVHTARYDVPHSSQSMIDSRRITYGRQDSNLRAVTHPMGPKDADCVESLHTGQPLPAYSRA